MRAWQAAIALTLLAGAVAQAQGDPEAGQRLAQAQCSTCHAIGPGPSESPAADAPPFADVARMPSTTRMALQSFLRTPHAPMPDIVLTARQLDDLAAYILSLQRGRPDR
jgi:mono/diheme cytochrome c family protein